MTSTEHAIGPVTPAVGADPAGTTDPPATDPPATDPPATDPPATSRAGAATTAWTVHVIADSDTRWKWGAALAERIAPAGSGPVHLHGHLLRGRATPSDRQLDDIAADVTSLRRVGIADLLDDLRDDDSGVVVLACVGGTIQALMHGLARAWEGRTRRPVIVTGYVGLVYERLVDGLLLRAGADVVLANSAVDEARFRAVFDAIGADPDSIVRSALPFLGGRPYDASAAGRDRPLTLCFVTQPSVPVRRDERRLALEQAVEHARLHPERAVLIKLRGRPGEQTTHIERHHYADLLPDVLIPANVDFVYGSMSDALDRSDLCVTVSSTAALEAMHRRIPTAVLTDFGVREELGNHVFLRSGALMSWRSLHDGAVPVNDETWMAENGLRDTDPYRLASERIADLAGGTRPLSPLRPWFRTDLAPGYLPRLLERNGLDEEGQPLGADADGRSPRPRLHRRMMRAAARRVYRVSVRRIEPAVRRWAQL